MPRSKLSFYTATLRLIINSNKITSSRQVCQPLYTSNVLSKTTRNSSVANLQLLYSYQGQDFWIRTSLYCNNSVVPLRNGVQGERFTRRRNYVINCKTLASCYNILTNIKMSEKYFFIRIR